MTKGRINRIAVNTGGGDAPGLNAVIRAVVRSAESYGWQVYGIEKGYDGIISMKGLKRLTRSNTRGILHMGGTILGTTNKGNPFRYPVQIGGKIFEKDLSDRVIKNLRRKGIDALVAIGGDGSLSIAHGLYKRGLAVVGVPKTIDNDVYGTLITFGFDPAVSTATEALDKLHTTASSHERVIVVEVMGRYAGWIALHSGVAGGADVVLIPEIPFNVEKVCEKVQDRYRRGRNFCIVVVAEGAKPKGKLLFTKGLGEGGRQEPILGGIAEWLEVEIQRRTHRDCRSLVLGHLQRGGSPTTFDRLLGTRLGAAAVELIHGGKFGHMVGLVPPNIVSVPLKHVVGKIRAVPLDSDIIRAARKLCISFGD